MSTTASTVRSLTSRPTLPELLKFKTSSGSTVNIVQEIGTNYFALGPLLLKDDTGAVTEAIISKHQRDADAINQEILKKWLQGKGKRPVNWSTLIDVLKDMELSELAEMIQEGFTSTEISSTEISGKRVTGQPSTHAHTALLLYHIMCMLNLGSEAHSLVHKAHPSLRPQSQPESEATSRVTPSSQVIEMTGSNTSSSVTTFDLSSRELIGSGSDRARAQAIAEAAAQLQDRFATIVTHTTICFMEKEEESRNFLKKFAITLTKLPLSNKHKHLHFLKEKERIRNAEDVEKIFDILDPHWNYMEYAFLERIIEEFGTSELWQEMKEYIAALTDFERNTSIKDYNSAALEKIQIPAHFEKLAITQLKDPAQCSLYEIRQLKNEIAEKSSLNKYSTWIVSVSCSSIKIVLAFPPEAYKHISAVLDEKFMKIHQLEVRP